MGSCTALTEAPKPATTIDGEGWLCLAFLGSCSIWSDGRRTAFLYHHPERRVEVSLWPR